MRIKVCGMREPDNILEVLSLPIDFMGFIFFKKSPRDASQEELIPWIGTNKEAFKDVKRVGVFVNSEIDFVLNKVHDFQLDYVQLHGEESAEYCQEIQSFWDASTVRRAKLIKAFSVDADFNFEYTKAYEPLCSHFLFDTKGANPGGNGVQFDWSLLEEYEGSRPFFLSGGIDEHSAAAIKKLSLPLLYGIDINSKFEVKPGLKDVSKLKSFVEEIREVSLEF